MSRFEAFERVYRTFEGADVCLAGNGPGISDFDPGFNGLVATMNSGLPFFDKIGRKVDLYWVQDRRALREKGDMIKPFLKKVDHILFNEEIAFLAQATHGSCIPIKMLGYKGFSKSIECGLFHGYTATFGLLQILGCLRVRSITMIGVGMNYFSGDTRFYQKERGFDVDLQRASEQVNAVKEAIRILSEDGIKIDIVGASILRHAS